MLVLHELVYTISNLINFYTEFIIVFNIVHVMAGNNEFIFLIKGLEIMIFEAFIGRYDFNW